MARPKGSKNKAKGEADGQPPVTDAPADGQNEQPPAQMAGTESGNATDTQSAGPADKPKRVRKPKTDKPAEPTGEQGATAPAPALTQDGVDGSVFMPKEEPVGVTENQIAAIGKAAQKAIKDVWEATVTSHGVSVTLEDCTYKSSKGEATLKISNFDKHAFNEYIECQTGERVVMLIIPAQQQIKFDVGEIVKAAGIQPELPLDGKVSDAPAPVLPVVEPESPAIQPPVEPEAQPPESPVSTQESPEQPAAPIPEPAPVPTPEPASVPSSVSNIVIDDDHEFHQYGMDDSGANPIGLLEFPDPQNAEFSGYMFGMLIGGKFMPCGLCASEQYYANENEAVGALKQFAKDSGWTFNPMAQATGDAEAPAASAQQ